MTENIGVGLWGVGAHARRTVLPALDKTPGIDIIGLTSRNAETAGEQARRWNCHHWTSPDEMLADDRVHAVFVATPTGLHFEHGMRVIEAGRHLWSEKALTVSLDETDKMAAAAKQRGVGLCTVCGPLYHAQFAALKDLISSGKIGALKHISAEFGFPHLESGNIRYRRDLGGGALLDVGFYLLAMAVRIVGEPPSQIHCTLETASGYEVDTAGSARLGFAGGVEANLDWGYGRPYCNALSLFGESGTARVSPAFSKPEGRSLDIAVQSAETSRTIGVPESDQFVEMLRVFAASTIDRALLDRLRNESVAQQTLIEKVRGLAG